MIQLNECIKAEAMIFVVTSIINNRGKETLANHSKLASRTVTQCNFFAFQERELIITTWGVQDFV